MTGLQDQLPLVDLISGIEILTKESQFRSRIHVRNGTGNGELSAGGQLEKQTVSERKVLNEEWEEKKEAVRRNG